MQSKKIFLFIILVTLVPYFIISFYCHPAGDDFSYAASSMHKGYWFSYARDYYNWNGRYTSNFLIFCSPLIWNSFVIYKCIPILLLGLSYLTLLLFFQTITNKKISNIDLHLFTSIALVLYLHNAPSFTETFYWYTGAITYQLANCFTLVYLSLLYRYCNCNYFITKTAHIIFLLLLIPVICGFNEVIMLIMLAFHILFILKWIQFKRGDWKLIGLLSLLVIGATAIMLFAPGNTGRASNFPNKYKLFQSLFMTVLQMGRFLSYWIFQLPFIAATILFVPISIQLSQISSFFKNKFYVSPYVTISSLIGIVFLCVFPAYWNMGMLGQHRTLNVAYFFFIPIWFMNLHLAVNYISSKIKLTIVLNKKNTVIFIILFFAGLFITKNGYDVSSDLLSGRATIYNNEMNMRYSKIKTVLDSGGKEVIITNLSIKPTTLYIYDITCDQKNWINKSYSDYFGVDRVQLRTCE